KKKDAILSMMKSDPATAGKMDREEKINKELRKSLIAGKKVVDQKVTEALNRAGYADPIARANKKFVEALRDSGGIEIDTRVIDPESDDRASVFGEYDSGDSDPVVQKKAYINPVFAEDYLRKKEALQKNCLEAFGN